MQKSLAAINNLVPLVLALGLPLSLLPLKPPYGFERNILLIAAFLILLLLSALTDASYRPYKTYPLLAAAALVLPAYLSAAGDSRWTNLTDLTLWAAALPLLLPAFWQSDDRANKTYRTHLLFLAGSLVAVIGLIRPIGPIGPVNQGLDYRTSLTVTRQTLAAAPLWGAGPGRFGQSFARFRPAEFNQRTDWTRRYELSRSGLLQFITEYGLIGLTGPIGLIMGLIRRIGHIKVISRKELLLIALPFGVVLAAFLLLPYSPGVFWGLSFLHRSYTAYKTNHNDD